MDTEGGGVLGPATGDLRTAASGIRVPALVGEGLIVAGAYVFAILSTALFAALAGSPLTWSPTVLLAVLGSACVLPGVIADLRARRTPRLASLALMGCGAIAVYLLATTGLPVRPYGDGAVFTQFVAEGRGVPRWLLGSTLAAAMHAATWELPSVQAWLPERLQATGAFLSILGTTVMVTGTWIVWRRWPGRLAVLLPVCVPVWMLFTTGYVEYYPLIAPAWLAALAWTFERPIEDRSADAIGVLAGLLPVVYLGFAPAAACILAVYVLRRPSLTGRTIAVAVAAAAVAVAACWPEGLVHYLRALISVINVGDAHLDARYAGQVAGPSSMLFSWQAAMSASHLREMGFLLVRGGGWWSLPLLVGTAIWRLREQDGWRVASRDGRAWLGLLLAAAHLFYFVFMVPRLGPVADVDLFFPTFVLIAFLAGHLLDGARDRGAHGRTVVVMAVALAALACTAPALLAGVLDAPR
ncbi:MAG TPA: hypothetical protein VMF13_10120 [Luteitalea sp.]|nr:hypothetical protein [Luteitalea sp.]